MSTTSKYFRQRGAALLFALLLVMTMLSLLALNQQLFDIQWKLGTSWENQRQMREYGLGAEGLALIALRRQAEDETTNLKQLWATANSSYPIEGGKVTGRIKDYQNCFNINGLIYGRNASAAGVASASRTLVMQQFLTLLSLSNTVVGGASQILERALDWVDRDIQLAGANGAESANYLRHKAPFYTPDASFGDLSEMQLWQVPQVQRLIDSGLFCARPSVEIPSINVNTLHEKDAVQLAALFFGQLSVEQAAEFIRQRPKNGYREKTQFVAKLMGQAALSDTQKALIEQQLLLRSYWFEVEVEVEVKDELGQRFEFMKSYIWVPRKGAAKVYRRLYGEY